MATHSTVHISTNLLTRTTVQLHNVPHKINANLVTNNQQQEETAFTLSTFKPNPMPSLKLQCSLHEEYQRLAVACQAN